METKVFLTRGGLEKRKLNAFHLNDHIYELHLNLKAYEKLENKTVFLRKTFVKLEKQIRARP